MAFCNDPVNLGALLRLREVTLAKAATVSTEDRMRFKHRVEGLGQQVETGVNQGRGISGALGRLR